MRWDIEWKRKNIVIATAILAGTALIIGCWNVALPYVKQKQQRQAAEERSIFQTYGEWYMKSLSEQKLTAVPGISDTHEGVTVTLSELWYDKMNLEFALKQYAPDGVKKFKQIRLSTNTGISDKHILMNNIDIGPAESALIASWGSTTIREDVRDQLPDQFELTVQAILEGSDEVWQMTVPVQAKTSLNKQLPLAVTKRHGQLEASYRSIRTTPTLTELVVVLSYPADQPLYPDDFTPRIQLMLEDENGIPLRYLGHGESGGSTRNGRTFYEYRGYFDPFKTMPESVIVRAFTQKWQRSQEMVDLPIEHHPTLEQPIIVDRGPAGSIHITGMETLPNGTDVHYTLKGKAPYTLMYELELVAGDGAVLGAFTGDRLLNPQSLAFVNRFSIPQPDQKLLLRYRKEPRKITWIPELDATLPMK